MTDTLTNIATLAGLFLYTIAVIVGFLVGLWLLYFIVTETKKFILFWVDEIIKFLEWGFKELGKGFIALLRATPSLIWMVISKAHAGAKDIHQTHKKAQERKDRKSVMLDDEYIEDIKDQDMPSPNEAEQITAFHQDD